VAGNKWWTKIPHDVTTATVNHLLQDKKSPEAGSSQLVSLPTNTIEVKAGWRPLNPSELASGRFHTQPVRFYEQKDSQDKTPCFRDATWGLISLHIIQKTASAPYFIYATFEQADNLLTQDGFEVENQYGVVGLDQPTATTPQVCLNDPKPAASGSPQDPSELANVILTGDPPW